MRTHQHVIQFSRSADNITRHIGACIIQYKRKNTSTVITIGQPQIEIYGPSHLSHFYTATDQTYAREQSLVHFYSAIPRCKTHLNAVPTACK